MTEPNHPPAQSPPPSARATRRVNGRGPLFQVAAVLLVVTCGLAGTGLARLARWIKAPPVDGGPEPAVKSPAGPGKLEIPKGLFAGWEKPDLVLLMTAQQHGYLLPCGCSEPQYGGLERRYNFLQLLKARGWPVAAVDLGDVPQTRGLVGLPNVQGLIKYRYSLTALDKMGYTAVGLGADEAALPLHQALAEYALQYETPRVVVANLKDAEKNFPLQTAPWKLADPKTTGLVRLGVTSVIGPRVRKAIAQKLPGDATVAFVETPKALDDVFGAMSREKVDLRVLLYQGPVIRTTPGETAVEALACAAAYDQFPLVLALSEEDNPPAKPFEVKTKAGTTSWVVTVGHKGRFLGVVGVWKTGKPAEPFAFRYQLVELGPEFKTPAGQEKDHPLLDLLEQYTAELKSSDYLTKHGGTRHLLQVMGAVEGLRNPAKPGEPTFVGSEVCKRCHEDAYDVWKKTSHSHAHQTLVEARNPGNRQFDPECIVCHTVGFGYQGGFRDAKSTPKLRDVGCESCHGPASVHVSNPDNAEWQKRLNPWKLPPGASEDQKKAVADKIDQMCQRCHDIDNDVTWIHGGLKKKWPKIDHPTPRPPGE